MAYTQNTEYKDSAEARPTFRSITAHIENSRALRKVDEVARKFLLSEQSGLSAGECMSMEKVNLSAKFASFNETWSPKIVGELNDSYMKLVKFSGEFVWHHHKHEDELFLVIKGTLRMKYREHGSEHEMEIRPGEFVVVPRGTEHLPVADEEVQVMLLEPKSTLNTGNVRNERTVEELERI